MRRLSNKEILQISKNIAIELPLEIASFVVKVSEIEPSSVITQGNPRVTSNGGVISDFCKVTCKLKDGRERFGYYREIRYGKSKWYCRIYLGWKLMDICGMNEENKSTYLEADDKKVLKSVWCVNPFKRVEGE